MTTLNERVLPNYKSVYDCDLCGATIEKEPGIGLRHSLEDCIKHLREEIERISADDYYAV